MTDDYIAVPTGLGPITKDQTIQYLLDRIEALERDRERLMAEVSDRSRDARREALEEAARVADGVRTTMDAGTACWIAAAIRALKEGE